MGAAATRPAAAVAVSASRRLPVAAALDADVVDPPPPLELAELPSVLGPVTCQIRHAPDSLPFSTHQVLSCGPAQRRKCCPVGETDQHNLPVKSASCVYARTLEGEMLCMQKGRAKLSSSPRSLGARTSMRVEVTLTPAGATESWIGVMPMRKGSMLTPMGP